jgi:hypothetical protein
LIVAYVPARLISGTASGTLVREFIQRELSQWSIVRRLLRR